LEDAPFFNAGTGSVLTREGRVEMDALVCDGRALASGAVTCVTSVAHPVTLARAVMERTPHLLLAGAGAEALADAVGLPRVPNDALVTDARRAQLAAALAGAGGPPALP